MTFIIDDWIDQKRMGYKCPYCKCGKKFEGFTITSGSLGKVENHTTNKVLNCCGRNMDIYITDETKRPCSTSEGHLHRR